VLLLLLLVLVLVHLQTLQHLPGVMVHAQQPLLIFLHLPVLADLHLQPLLVILFLQTFLLQPPVVQEDRKAGR